MKTPLALITLVTFLIAGIGPMPAYAQDYYLPAPGVMVHLSPPLDPPILKGIKVHPDNPFRFDFIIEKGDNTLSNEQLKDESSKLIKYFLASLTIPEKDLWVNLSPYEKDRIIPNSFGLTEMGRDLLAEDYMLKQITASLIYPKDGIGKKFWKRVYEEAAKRYGTTDIPVNTFNKVWIVPEKAEVYENAKAGTAYVVDSKLKVMLEQDYLSLKKHEGIQSQQAQVKDTSQLGSQVVREVIIPQLTTEVNENKNFAHLRQVYNSLILATWYKKKIKDSLLEQVYADKNKVAGVNIDDPREKERIYQKYLRAFKKGVFNYIQEDIDPGTQETIPRKYFSGGMNFSGGETSLGIDGAMIVNSNKSFLINFSLLYKIAKGSLIVVAASLFLSGTLARGDQLNPAPKQGNFLAIGKNPDLAKERELIREYTFQVRSGDPNSFFFFSRIQAQFPIVSSETFKSLEDLLNDKNVHDEKKIELVNLILGIIDQQPDLLKVSRRKYVEGLLMNSNKSVGQLAGDYLMNEYIKEFNKGQLPLTTIEKMLNGDWVHQRIAAKILAENIYPAMIQRGQMTVFDLKPMIEEGGIRSAVAARTFKNLLTTQNKGFFNRDDLTVLVDALVSVLKVPPIAEHPPIIQTESNEDQNTPTVPSSSTQESLKALLALINKYNGTLPPGYGDIIDYDTSQWLYKEGFFERGPSEFNFYPSDITENLRNKLKEKYPDKYLRILIILQQAHDSWDKPILSAVKQFVEKDGYNGDAYNVLFQIAINNPSLFQPTPLFYFEKMSYDSKFQGGALVDILSELYSPSSFMREAQRSTYGQQLRQKNSGKNVVIQKATAEAIVNLDEHALVADYQYVLSVPGLDLQTYATAASRIVKYYGLDALVDSMDLKGLSDLGSEMMIYEIMREVSEDQGKITPRIITILSRAVQREGMQPDAYNLLAEIIKQNPASFDPRLVQVLNAMIPGYLSQHGFECWEIYLNDYFSTKLPQIKNGPHQDILRYEIASSVYRLIIGSGQKMTDKNIEDGIEFTIILRGRTSDINPFSSKFRVVNILHAQQRFEKTRLEKLELQSGADRRKISSHKGPSESRKALREIAKSIGPLTIFSSGHGGRNHLYQEYGTRTGDDVNTNMNDPNAISYKILGNALWQKALGQGKRLDNVIIILDDCYSSDFRDNLIKYLRSKGLKRESFPKIISFADINSNSYGDDLLLDLEKVKKVSLSIFLNPSSNTLNLEKPTVVVPIPQDLRKRFPQFVPIPLQIGGPSYQVPYQTAPPEVQISTLPSNRIILSQSPWGYGIETFGKRGNSVRFIPHKDAAMRSKGPEGGIDLTSANMNFQTRNNGGEIKFHLDPAMLQQLQNAPGFVPMIINIQLLKSLPEFLGLNQESANKFKNV